MSAVHGLPSSHAASSTHSGWTPTHTPAMHASLTVPATPSSQTVPSDRACAAQVPATPSQAPALHWSATAPQSSGPLGTHCPWPSHASPIVQNAPSSHGKPAGEADWTQANATQDSDVQGSPSEQSACSWHSGATPAHPPGPHWSLTVSGSPSSHDAPAATSTATHPWPASRQLPAAHGPSRSLQSIGAPWHVPPAHVSPSVQKAPSSHPAPSFAGSFTHAPPTQAPALHASATAPHWLDIVHSTATPPSQVPAAQVSPTVFGSPSSHALPSKAGAPTQPSSGSEQIPTSHWAAAPAQSGGAPPTQVPVALQASAPVQTFPSSHAVPSAAAACTQANATQESTVHCTPSSQSESARQSAAIPAHSPAPQLSLTVSGSPSSQGSPSDTGLARQSFWMSLHTPTVQPESCPEQSVGAPGTHSPETPHSSPSVQNCPSSHPVPGAFSAT